MNIERVLLVNKKSLYQLYVKEHHQAAFQRALRRGDPVARRMRETDRTQQLALRQVRRTLDALGLQVVERWRANVRTIAGFDLIVSCGGDGTLLDASHLIVNGTPLLGINSDPRTSVGVLCAGTAAELGPLLEALGDGTLTPQRMTRLRVRTEGRELLGPCLNDVLFAHASPAQMTKFELAVLPASAVARGTLPARRATLPMQRSSGLWVSTPCGATAAIRSAGGRAMRRGSRLLQYLVREPYVPPSEPRIRGLGGMVRPDEALVLVSRVRRGMLWADGHYRRTPVSYGEPVIIDEHPTPLRLIPRPG